MLKFEHVGLTQASELRGLQSVKGYGDRVASARAGGFENSFAQGNGWTPDVLLDFAGGHDVKTVNSWRAGWEGEDGANYLLDGDDGGPYYYSKNDDFTGQALLPLVQLFLGAMFCDCRMDHLGGE